MNKKLFLLCLAFLPLAGCETSPPAASQASQASPPPKRTVSVYVTSEPSGAWIMSQSAYTPANVLVKEGWKIAVNKAEYNVNAAGENELIEIGWSDVLDLPETDGKRHWHVKFPYTRPYLDLHRFGGDNFKRLEKSPQGVVAIYGGINTIREDAAMVTIVLDGSGLGSSEKYVIVRLPLSEIGPTDLLAKDTIWVLGRAKGYATLSLASGGSIEVPLVEAGAIRPGGGKRDYVRPAYREAAKLWAEGNLWKLSGQSFSLTVEVP